MKKILTIILAIAVMFGAFSGTALAALDNAISGRTVTVTGDTAPHNNANQLRKAYDGNSSTIYVSKTVGEAKTLIVDLGEVKEIDSINILYNYTANTFWLTAAEVYPGCADGTYDFMETPVYSSTSPTIDTGSKTYFLEFDNAVTARYFKLVVTPNSTATVRIAELEFLNRSENLLASANVVFTSSAGSKTNASFPEKHLFDGSIYTRWATGSKNNAWTLTADFGTEKTVNYIDMTDFTETVAGIEIYTSSDGVTYNDTPAASITRTTTGTTAQSVPLSYTFAPVTARYMKVVLKPVSTKSMTMWDFGLYNMDYQEQFEKDIDDTVTFKADGNVIASVSEGVLSADVTVSNSSSNTAYPITYIMAVRDGSKLIDTQTYKGTVAAGGTTSFTLTSVDTSELENVEVNLYRWDTEGRLVPYARVYDLPADLSDKGTWTVAGGIVGTTTSDVADVCDGDLSTSWTPGAYNATGLFMCTFDSAKTVNTIRVVQGANSAINNFVVEYSNDGKTWERCYDGAGMDLSAATDGTARISFAPVTAKYFRFFIQKQTKTYEICELELLNEMYDLSIPKGTEIITVTSPHVRDLVQRDEQNSAEVKIAGEVDLTNADSVTVKAEPMNGYSSGMAVAERTMPLSATGGFDYDLTLSGGYYKIIITAKKNGTVVDTKEVEKVGVGEIFITAGQSNSASFGEFKTSPDNDMVSSYDFQSQRWVLAEDPQAALPVESGSTGTGGSAWPSAGDILANDLKVPVGFMNVGIGGTSVSSWNSYHYTRIEEAINEFGENGVRAILWHQGETDSCYGTTAVNYQNYLTSIIEKVRTDVGWDVPWIVAIASYHSDARATDENEANIRVGQQAVVDNCSNVFLGPDTDDMLDGYRDSSGVHFNISGLQEHGKRWATAIKTAFANVY